MELRDFIATPIIIFLVYTVGYLVRPFVTDEVNRKYFFPALTVRIFGALMLGFIYQFYYSGGDTFNYHTHGSRIVWETFMNDPISGLKLIFGSISDRSDLYGYSSRIYFHSDTAAYFVIRIASLFDLITFSSYSATAVLFAATSLAGGWAFFVTFYRRYPHLHFSIAMGSLFIPSLFFWGSGILKDTIVLAALGFATLFIDRIFFQKRKILINALLLLFTLFIIFEIKKFILQAFIPAAVLWISFKQLLSIRSVVLRVMVFPLVALLIGYGAYWTVVKVGEGDRRYAVDKLAQTAKITAYDIGFYTGRDAGSRYSLGELEGTFASMIQKAPGAVNVTLFRPYLWEVNSPLMLLSALESLCVLGLVLYVLLARKMNALVSLKNPDIIFLLTFSIVMAFAVGITSYNFGTLSRYKVPLLPFFVVSMILILGYSKSERKLDELDATE